MKTKKASVNRENWQTTRSERLNYYIGDLGRTLEGYIVTAFMTLFLLFQGINLVKISAAILIVKIIDACDDVVFGFLIDKLNIRNSRLLGKLAGEGKYLPWYRATFFLFPIFTVIFFLMPQEASDTLKIGWFMVTYLLYDLSYTLVEVPMNSMIVSLTDNVDERNSILQFKGILSGIFTVLAGVVWMFLVSEHVGFSMRAVAIVSSVIFFIMMLPLATKVKEHNVELKNAENEQETQHYTFRDMLECIKTNKYKVIVFYQEKKYWPFILTFVHLWKALGFSTVVYLASIVGISPELYEAARMDGASKWQQIKNVTLPNLVPTAITLFILSVGKIFFSDFGLFYQVPRNSGMLFSATQTIDTYVYNALMVNNNIALSSAASVLQSVCGVVCILLANWVVRKISEENAMF